MLEQEFKNKIVNTLSQYKHKCDKLEDEISVLKTAIYQLSLLPNGIYVGLDRQMHNLQTNIQENKDSDKIKKSVDRLVSFCRKNHPKLARKKALPPPSIDRQVNARISQLLEHLLIPDALEAKLTELQANLEEQLNTNTLIDIINKLTDFVIEAFNLEHHQLKEFLNQFAHYPQDFHSDLERVSNNNLQAQEASEQLEEDLAHTIKTIQGHIKQSKTIPELSNKIKGHLQLISQHVRTYRKEQARGIKNEAEEIKTLQGRLMQTECRVKQIKQQLSSHKITVNQDPLTALPNRLNYDNYVLQAFHRWQRGFGEVSLALADIDHFKALNTQYGYLTGDNILKKIAKTFRSSVRAVDFIARYSEEEFIFIFERTPVHNAWKVLENLRTIIEETDFRHQNKKIAVTTSFGLSSLQQGDTIETVFARVNKAIDRAKQSGRNRVMMVEK